ncbi:MAG: hypothetical protein GEV04_14970 [Actinophytocola sp.]|nr:hypothetical protein [Actinophytocola sp.]
MRRTSQFAVALTALLLTACSTGGGQTSSQGDEAPLAGETVELVVPYDPGGGYDVYARLLAPYLEKCLDATVVVKNEPGAGGLLATSKTFVAPPDSLRTVLTNTVGVVGSQLADAPGASFDAAKFSWLGRVSAEPNVLAVAADSEFKTFDDLRESTKPIRFVATGPGSNEHVNSEVLPELYGFPAETITGFDGSDSARAAVLSGDADAHILPIDSQLDGIESGDMRPLLLLSEEPHDALPDVPTVADLPPEQGQDATLDALMNLSETGRSLAGPPGMDPEQMAALREGISCALGNKELLAKAEKQQRDVDPLTGDETVNVVNEALRAPAEFTELIK